MVGDLCSVFVETSKGWDKADDHNLQFNKATLACDMKPFKKGQVVDCIELTFLDTPSPSVTIYDKGEVWEFPVNDVIFLMCNGKKIEPEATEGVSNAEV